MSGGHWNYKDEDLVNEIFGWGVSVKYGLDREELKAERKIVRKADPLEVKLISELVYDVFCLLHSYDWYASCDTCEETYRKDVKFFKVKWLKRLDSIVFIDDILADAKDDIYKALEMREE